MQADFTAIYGAFVAGTESNEHWEAEGVNSNEPGKSAVSLGVHRRAVS